MMNIIKRKKIDTLLFSHFLKIFIRVLSFTSLIAIITSLYGTFYYLYDRGIGGIAYFKICFIFLITILPFIIIIATIFSSTLLCFRLNKTLELYALQSLGISYFKILTTLLKPVFIIFFLAFLNAHYLFPQATAKMINLGFEIIKKNPTAVIKPNVFTKDIKGICIYAKEKINKSSFKDVAIYKNEKGKKMLALAEKATIENVEGNLLRITLENGNSYSGMSYNNRSSTTGSFHFSFEKQTIIVNLNDVLFSLGIKQNSTLFKNSLVLYEEIKEQKKILETNIKGLFNIKEEEKEKKYINLYPFFSLIAPEEDYKDTINEQNIYPTYKISNEEKEKNMKMMQTIEKKIKTYEKNFKREIKDAKEGLLYRDSLAFQCLILFLLCFSLGFLLHRCSYIKLLLISFLICLYFFFSFIYTKGKNINVYSKCFDHILILIPFTLLAIYYANKNDFTHMRKVKNTIRKYTSKIKDKVKALLIKFWECL